MMASRIASRAKADTFLNDLTDFLDDPLTDPDDVQRLRDYILARPAREKIIQDYVTDIEIRLDIAKDIERGCKNSRIPEEHLTVALWSFLLIAPLDAIKSLRDELLTPVQQSGFKDLTAGIYWIANTIPGVLKLFLAKPLSKEDNRVFKGLKRKRGKESVGSNINRNDRAREIARQRDSVCVVTGAPAPEICHIFPFSAKHCLKDTDIILHSLKTMYEAATLKKYKDLLATKDKEIIDTPQNMICLAPLLHTWWSQGKIGFEPVERLENGIRLRFWWLNPTGKQPDQEKAILHTDPRPLFRQFALPRSQYVSNFNTGRLVHTGTIITITADEKENIPNWDIFSLQWDLIRMCALSGAAGWPTIIEDDSDEDNDEEDRFPIDLVLRPKQVRANSPTKETKQMKQTKRTTLERSDQRLENIPRFGLS